MSEILQKTSFRIFHVTGFTKNIFSEKKFNLFFNHFSIINSATLMCYASKQAERKLKALNAIFSNRRNANYQLLLKHASFLDYCTAL